MPLNKRFTGSLTRLCISKKEKRREKKRTGRTCIRKLLGLVIRPPMQSSQKRSHVQNRAYLFRLACEGVALNIGFLLVAVAFPFSWCLRSRQGTERATVIALCHVNNVQQGLRWLFLDLSGIHGIRAARVHAQTTKTTTTTTTTTLKL